MSRKPVMLVVLDGWGIAEPSDTNAISMAQTPVFDELMANCPNTAIFAHGEHVGLPGGQMGNSEVGHLNLGAGRIVRQDLVRINDDIKAGGFAKNKNLTDTVDTLSKNGKKVHIIGLCSPGGVHSSLDHLYALVDLFSDSKIKTCVHAITDGRDTPPSSAGGYLKEIEKRIENKALIATVVGRYWAMDRDKRWDRVSKGYHAFVLAEGVKHKSVDEAVSCAYEAKETDEFINPRIITDDSGVPLGTIDDGDAVVFFNFRADRAREITSALAFANFDGFERRRVPQLSRYVCMTEFQADFKLPMAYPPESLENILGKVISGNGLAQLRCAETEKYAHVTFFFNGGEEVAFENEDRKLIPSPREVATYDQKPQMSALEVCDAVLEAVESDKYDFILVNFANPDMVGHTGIIEAAIEAATTVDKQVGRIKDAVQKKGGAMIITADHGNSEQMRDLTTGQPHTAHTNNPVPVILVDDQRKNVQLAQTGALKDIAPTVLELLGLKQPSEMTGKSLILK